MELVLEGSLLAAVTIGAGFAQLCLLWLARSSREHPGGTLFLILIGMMGLLCFSYGAGLLVFEPLALRAALEIGFLASALVGSILWMLFALAYTGRGHLLRTPPAIGLLGLCGLLVLFLITNPYHELIWTNFELFPTAGAATVAYDRQVGLYLLLIVAVAFIGFAQLLLFDTLASYGEFFRSQIIALLLTPIFPTVAAVLYVFELGPFPQYNLLPLSLLPHMMLDTYALFSGGLFTFSPATRRVGERTAVDDLDSPVITVDGEGHIVSGNDAAKRLLEADVAAIIGDELDRHLNATVDLTTSEQDVTIRAAGKRRHYRVTTSSFSSAGGAKLGYTIVFQNITDIIQRERRFAVVNRVLRHNLRNDLQVVSGHAELLHGQLDESQSTESADAIIDETKRLLDLAERARELDETVGGVTVPEDPVSLRSVVEECTAEAQSIAPDVTIETDVPDALELHSDPGVIQLVIDNLIENAVRHNDAPTVSVTVRRTEHDGESGSVWLDVEDDGSGIPEHEIAAIEEGTETALKHGSGLGLWVVKSGVTALGGDVSFDTTADGTRVTLRIPGLVTNGTATENAPETEPPIRT